MAASKALPEGWRWVKLGEVCEVNPKDGFYKDLPNDLEVTFVPMAAVDDEKGAITQPQIRKLGEVRKGYTKFKEGDVIFAKITPCMENGKAAIALNLKNSLGFGSTEFHVLRPTNQTIAEYIYFYIRQPFFRDDAQMNMTGTAGQLRVPADFMKNVGIPLPPLSEQRRIVSILEKAKETKRFRAQADELTDRMLQSVFLEMFGDPVKNPKWWGVKALKDVVANERYSLKRGPFGGSIKKEIFVSKGYKVYEQKHAIYNDFNLGGYYITKEKYNEMKPFAVQKDDLIISCSGTIGKIAIVPDDAEPGIINQALLKITLNFNKALPIFMKYLLETNQMQRVMFGSARGSGIKNVTTMPIIKSTKFIVPPLPFQQKFAQVVEKVKEIRKGQNQSSQEINNLFNTLMQKAFKGELLA